MTNSGCKVVQNIKRLEQALIEQLRPYPVANIDDCMNRLGAIDSSIRPMNGAKLLGSAFTVKVPAGDNLMLHKALDLALPGDVLLVDAGGYLNHAICGSIMLSYCIARGIAGVIIDGSIRDVDEISRMPLPVYARGASPNGPYKNGPGEINTPVVIGGKVVNPGDVIAGDSDGVIVITPESVKDLVVRARQIQEKELRIMEDITSKGIYPRPWVDEQLKAIGCEIVTEEVVAALPYTWNKSCP